MNAKQCCLIDKNSLQEQVMHMTIFYIELWVGTEGV